MMKKIKSFFTSKNKMFFDPSESDNKTSNKHGEERRESFKQLECPDDDKIDYSPASGDTEKASDAKEDYQHKSNTSTMDEFEFVSPIPEDCYNDVIDHLRNNFITDEPLLNKSVAQCELGELNAELEAYSLKTLADQLSVMAVDKETHKIVAVSLHGISLPGDIEQERKRLENIADGRFKQIFTLFYDLNDSADLFSKFNVDKIFDARILSVDSNYRGKGLAKKCIAIGEQVAKEHGFELIKAEPTGIFSQKILISLGWDCVHELKYEDYVDDDGKQILKPPPPHEYLKVMVKCLK